MSSFHARLSIFTSMLLVAGTGWSQAPKDAKPPTVETRPATTLGNDAMTPNGSIHPHGLPTTYWFEYGPTNAYGQKTAVRPLPPRLAAHYLEDWNDNGGAWYAGRAAANELVYHATGGVTGGFMRYKDPSFDDHNHDNGIGTVHLAMYCYPGPWGKVARVPSLQLGGGDPDFRDARISIALRGQDWVPNGSMLQWWTQAQTNIEILHDPKKSHVANWAYTGTDLTDHLRSGKWEKAAYRLWNDTEKWTYTGGTRIYKYISIDFCQHHLNVDFFHMVTFVDVKNRPKGAIDFDDIEMTYHNHSLVLPTNGGKLLRSPESPDDPATLTDGWRNGKGRAWKSAANPGGPLEFVYGFENPVTVKTVQLHNNPEWPSKDVEVLVSEDDKTYTPLVKNTLPEKGVPNPNFAFTLDKDLNARARFLKVRVLSGFKKDHWGLGEIEIFGTGATMIPENEVNYVNLDIDGLKAGAEYHYRLVAQNAGGTTTGADRSFTVPADQKPIPVTYPADRVTADTARLFGRLTPMGPETKYYFEFGPDTKYGSKTPLSVGGIQITPRTVFADATGLKSGTTYHYRLAAVNEKGTTMGPDASFTTK